VQQRQRERGGLAGARRRVAQQIAPLDERRNGLLLNWGGLLIPEFPKCGEKFVPEPEVAEGGLVDGALPDGVPGVPGERG